MSTKNVDQPTSSTDGSQKPAKPVDAGPAAPAQAAAMPPASPPPPVEKRRSISRLIVPLIVVLAVLGAGFWYARSLETVSTDDAYVNGHVTFVAPRVAGQVATVLVDDNNRVRKGDLLVQLDKEPFLVRQQ